MPLARHRVALALTAAVFVAGVAMSAAPAFAQDPPNAGAAKGQGKANPNANAASKKKPARRKPRGNGAVGLIVPYPFPPVLIIRQTPEVHDEIQAFLNMLRYN
jgi:hypothetical protein